MLKLGFPEVLASVRSLYADELKPYGRVVMKRIRERAAASAAAAQGLPLEAVDPDSMPRIDPKRLRRICHSSPTQLRVDPEEANEFSAILVGCPCTFLDVCSPVDPYSPQMWAEATAYFASLSGEEMRLPGGRYACARVLLGRGLPFLSGFSLGKVCHVVQLAIAQKQLLGYLDGRLVPRQHSEEWVKEQHAFHQQPLISKKRVDLPVASWAEARNGLSEILDTECNPDPGVVTLSNVKRLFRSRFQLDLSETALGYSRLFDLLRDPCFHDVCTVQSHKNGQLLVERVNRPPRRLHPVGRPDLQFPEVGCSATILSTPPMDVSGGIWNHVYMGSFVMSMPVSMPRDAQEMSTYAPSLATLKTATIDMGMETAAWGLSPGASPLASPRAMAKPWDSLPESIEQDLAKKFENVSGAESTDVPLPDSPSSAFSGSSDDEFDAALDADLCRMTEIADTMEQGVLTPGDSGKWPVLPCLMRAGRRHIVKNTFIEICQQDGDSARRSKSEPPNRASR